MRRIYTATLLRVAKEAALDSSYIAFWLWCFASIAGKFLLLWHGNIRLVRYSLVLSGIATATFMVFGGIWFTEALLAIVANVWPWQIALIFVLVPLDALNQYHGASILKGVRLRGKPRAATA